MKKGLKKVNNRLPNCSERHKEGHIREQLPSHEVWWTYHGRRKQLNQIQPNPLTHSLLYTGSIARIQYLINKKVS